MHAIAGKAVCFWEALQPEFKLYAKRTLENAGVLADRLIENGLAVVSTNQAEKGKVDVLEGLARLVMTIRNGTFTYSQNSGLLLPATPSAE